MKACRWYQLEFPGTLSGDLRMEEEERVRDHVGSCPDCRAELDQLQRIDVLLTAGLPEPARVRQFQEGFLARLDAEVNRDRVRRPRRLVTSLFQPALLPLAAAAGVAGFLVWNTPADTPAIDSPVPAVTVAEAAPDDDGVVDATTDGAAGASAVTADLEEEEPSEVMAVPAVAEVGTQQDALLDSEPGLFLDYAVVRDFDDTEMPVLVPDGNG